MKTGFMSILCQIIHDKSRPLFLDWMYFSVLTHLQFCLTLESKEA